MANRHQRRKRARERWERQAEGIVSAHYAWLKRKAERSNPSGKARRSPKGIGNRSVYSGATADVARGSAGMKLYALDKADVNGRGKARGRFRDDRCPTEFDGIDGSELSGITIRRRAERDLKKKLDRLRGVVS